MTHCLYVTMAACQNPLPVRWPVTAAVPLLAFMNTGLSVRFPAPAPTDCVGASGVHGGLSARNVETFEFATTPKRTVGPLTAILPESTGGLLPEFVWLGPSGFTPSGMSTTLIALFPLKPG
jgi:hypothetical protein